MGRKINYDLHKKVLEAYDPAISINETARRLGVNPCQVHNIFSYYGIKSNFKSGKELLKDTSRDDDMVKRFKSGETMQSIGDDYGISRERVRQILSRYNITGNDGGKTKTAKDKMATYKLKLDNKYLKSFECTRKERNSFPEEVIDKFTEKRRNVISVQKQTWAITLPEFADFVMGSGLLKKLGRGKNGYSITRIDWDNLWTIDNVQIVPNIEVIRLRDKFKKSTLAKAG